MEVVLRKDLENLGEIDDVVRVAGGYARNFLLPQRLAVVATKSELVAVGKRGAEKTKRLAAKKAEFEQLAQKLASLEIKISAGAGEEGKLFGSVTSQDIADAIKAIADVELNKKKIHLSEAIKALGEYTVTVRLYKEISAVIKVVVEKKAEDKAEKKKEETAEKSEQ